MTSGRPQRHTCVGLRRWAGLALLAGLLAVPVASRAQMLDDIDGINPITQQLERRLGLGTVPADPVPAEWKGSTPPGLRLQLSAASGDTAPERQLVPGWCLVLDHGLEQRDLLAQVLPADTPERLDRLSCRGRQRFRIVPQLSSDPAGRDMAALLSGPLAANELFLLVREDDWQREGWGRLDREALVARLAGNGQAEALLITDRLGHAGGRLHFGRGLAKAWRDGRLDGVTVFVHGTDGRVAAMLAERTAADRSRLRSVSELARRNGRLVGIGPVRHFLLPAGRGVPPALAAQAAAADAAAPPLPAWRLAWGDGRRNDLDLLAITNTSAEPVARLRVRPQPDQVLALTLADGATVWTQTDERGRVTELHDGRHRHSYLYHPRLPLLTGAISGDGRCARLLKRVQTNDRQYFVMLTEQCGQQAPRFEQNAVRLESHGRWWGRQLSRVGATSDYAGDWGRIDD